MSLQGITFEKTDEQYKQVQKNRIDKVLAKILAKKFIMLKM